MWASSDVFSLRAQVSEAEGSQLGSEHKAMFREISVSESPADLTEAINMAVIESLPSTEFLSQVKFINREILCSLQTLILILWKI